MFCRVDGVQLCRVETPCRVSCAAWCVRIEALIPPSARTATSAVRIYHRQPTLLLEPQPTHFSSPSTPRQSMVHAFTPVSSGPFTEKLGATPHQHWRFHGVTRGGGSRVECI